LAGTRQDNERLNGALKLRRSSATLRNAGKLRESLPVSRMQAVPAGSYVDEHPDYFAGLAAGSRIRLVKEFSSDHTQGSS